MEATFISSLLCNPPNSTRSSQCGKGPSTVYEHLYEHYYTNTYMPSKFPSLLAENSFPSSNIYVSVGIWFGKFSPILKSNTNC